MTLNALSSPSMADGISLPHGKKVESPARIREAASQFESLMINEMLKSSRAAGGSGLLGNTQDQNSTLVEMGEQQLAQALASQGGFGIAKMVVAGLNQNANR